MRFCVLVALDLIHRTTRGRWGLFVIFGSWWVALDLIHRTTRGRWGLFVIVGSWLFSSAAVGWLPRPQ